MPSIWRPSIAQVSGLTAALNAKVETSTLGQPNGPAVLNENGDLEAAIILRESEGNDVPAANELVLRAGRLAKGDGATIGGVPQGVDQYPTPYNGHPVPAGIQGVGGYILGWGMQASVLCTTSDAQPYVLSLPDGTVTQIVSGVGGGKVLPNGLYGIFAIRPTSWDASLLTVEAEEIGIQHINFDGASSLTSVNIGGNNITKCDLSPLSALIDFVGYENPWTELRAIGVAPSGTFDINNCSGLGIDAMEQLFNDLGNGTGTLIVWGCSAVEDENWATVKAIATGKGYTVTDVEPE